MKLFLFGLPLAILLAGASFATLDDTPTATAVVETATHTVRIEYHEQRGLWRRATVSLRMDEADRPWRGKLQGVSFNGLRPASPRAVTRAREAGYPLVGRLLSSGHQTGVRMYVPAPENLKRLWLQGERGSTASVRIWTEYHNPSTYGDDDTEDPPKDPPGDDDGGDGDGGGDNDDCGPWPPGCEVYDPFNCKCDIGLEDPWGDEAQVRGSSTSFGF